MFHVKGLDSLQRRIGWLGLAGTVAAVLAARVVGTGPWADFADNVHWTISALAGWLLAVLSWRQRPPGTERTLVGWLTAGLAGYTLGQLAWDMQAFVGYTVFPAPSDPLYLSIGPLFVFGLLRTLHRQSTGVSRNAALLDFAMIVLALLALTLVLYLPKRGNLEGLALLTVIAYPSTWLAAFAALAIVAMTLRWRFDLGLAVLGFTLLGEGLIWMRWNFLLLDGSIVPGSWLNASFSAGNLLLGYGIARCTVASKHTSRWARWCEGALRLLPMLMVLAAALSLVLAQQFLDLPPAVSRLSIAGSITVLLLALARQSLLLREYDALVATQAALVASEATLAAEKAHLTTVLATIPDLVWLKDLNGVFLGCNRRVEDMLGADAAGIIGKTDYDFMPRDLADFFRENDRLALACGQARTNEETLNFARGGYQGVFETIKTPMYAADGTPIGVLGIARDITERQRARDQLAIQAGILASLPEGIHLVRSDFSIVYANPQLERLFGYGPSELLGQLVSVLNAPNGDDPEATAAAIAEAVAAKGSWEGDVRNVRKDGAQFWSHAVVSSFDHPEFGKVWVSVHEDATARKLAEEEVRSLAFYDPLTHLPNRRLMIDRAHQAMAASARSGLGGALFLIDLDNFKTLNDTLGHDVGDQLLVSVSARLVGSLREGDTVARLGGDEFVAILGNLDAGDEGAVQAEAAAHKILSVLGVPHDLTVTDDKGIAMPRQHQCTPSIGICLFDGHQLGVDELLKRADTAMYQAKRAGRNTACFYDPRMQEAIQLRATLEEEIRAAIFSGQFVLYFQPQVDGAGRLFGAEVLLRWQHPTRGMVSPALFVPLAEETGLILPIGHQVLLKSCEQLAAWGAMPGLSHLMLSVNVSARQMSVPSFSDEVISMVRATGISPERLKLELTEGLLLHNTEDVIAKMEALRRDGVRFSLDDFGTGYSSLSYLKRLPLDQLKIDQSFVHDLLTDTNDEAIARTVIALGHSLGLHVIAEGVETTEQRDALRGFGCDAYQGYLFGRPVPAAEFEELARNWPVPADA